MNKVNVVFDYPISEIDALMRAQFGERIAGMSSGPDGTVVWFLDTPTGDDLALAQNVCNQYDPAYLSTRRDGSTITVDVWLPRNLDNLTEVTLTVEGVALPEATALTEDERGGVSGQEVLKIEGEITVGIQGEGVEVTV